MSEPTHRIRIYSDGVPVVQRLMRLGCATNDSTEHEFHYHDLKRTDPPESHDERLQRVERTMLALTQEWLELTGRAEPPVPVTADAYAAINHAVNELTRLSRFAALKTGHRIGESIQAIAENIAAAIQGKETHPPVTPATLSPLDMRRLREAAREWLDPQGPDNDAELPVYRLLRELDGDGKLGIDP